MNDENAYYNPNSSNSSSSHSYFASEPSMAADSQTPVLAFNAHKGALSFILSSSSDSSSDSDFQAPVVPTASVSSSRPLVKRKRVRPSPTARAAAGNANSATREATRLSFSGLSPQAASDPASQLKKGSKFCVVDGCMSRAKHAKRCWRHGGSVKCKVAECDNRAKSKGVCWSHGGGTLCSFESCDTISVSNGFCWAHGGGKRCAVHQCSKPAYERTQNYCTSHFEERVGGRQQGDSEDTE